MSDGVITVTVNVCQRTWPRKKVSYVIAYVIIAITLSTANQLS